MNFVIYNMDVLAGLGNLKDNSIDCVFTSPPYWALRDYGVPGQLGLEPTFKEFVEKLVTVFDEVKRVLKPTGTCFVNLGDTYSGSNGAGYKQTIQPDNYATAGERNKDLRKQAGRIDTLEAKNLCNIPARFSIAMQDHGWILRNTIIWQKPSCMPSSVKDRFTVDFEYLYFFVKEQKYYFERQIEELSESYLKENRPMGILRQRRYKNSKFVKEETAPNQFKGKATKEWMQKYQKNEDSIHGANAYSDGGRNMRCVWSIPPEPYKEAHFACYPTELVRRGLKAGCPKQVCKKCGNPKIIEYEPTEEYAKFLGKGWHDHENDMGAGMGHQTRGFSERKGNVQFIKEKYKHVLKETCQCAAEFEAGIVLDPFVGSGTTLFVAQDLKLNGVGIEINTKYVPLMVKRLNGHEEQQCLNEEKIKVVTNEN